MSSLGAGTSRDEQIAATVEEIECGSDEEHELRGLWLSRLMFGPLLDPALAYREERSYEEWLAAHGLVLT